jgi:RNAse (barnase) inhibitor barstar
MDGSLMSDSDGVFHQFYEHLKLPDYFGWNWNALRDCLRDFHWLNATLYLIAIDEAEKILRDEPGERATFFKILNDSAETWATAHPDPRTGEGTPFNVVFLCQPQFHKDLNGEISGTNRVDPA